MAEPRAEMTLAGPLLTLVLSRDGPDILCDLRDRRTGESLLGKPSPVLDGMAATALAWSLATPPTSGWRRRAAA